MFFNVVLNKYQLLFRHNRQLAPDFYNFVIVQQGRAMTFGTDYATGMPKTAHELRYFLGS